MAILFKNEGGWVGKNLLRLWDVSIYLLLPPPKIRAFLSIQYKPQLETTIKQNKEGFKKVLFSPPPPRI